jgi:hypothetical protein
MNIRLQTLITEAEARLSASEQARLADLVQAYVTSHEEPDDFTPAERAHLALIDAEAFEPADPEEVIRVFARRG